MLKAGADHRESTSNAERALNVAFATIAFGPDGVARRANNAALRLLDCEQTDIVGRSVVELWPFGSRNEPDAATLWEHVLGGAVSVTELRRQTATGRNVWVKSHLSVLRDADGDVQEVIEICSDVTEQVRDAAEHLGQIAAIEASQAVVHFSLDGTILYSNKRFLDMMGYGADEVLGRHHSMFVDPAYAESEPYQDFWRRLRTGEHQSGEFARIDKGGKEVWLQATYSTLLDPQGLPSKIIKYASDITTEKLRHADFEWQVSAIHKSHCTITFDMRGVILDANENFLDAVGYTKGEIIGRHHRMFVEPAFSYGGEYAAFWRALSQGKHQSGEFKRINKAGQEIWLQAAYYPVFDPSGRAIKVVKVASVITEEKLRQAEHQGQIAAINRAQAVIAFTLDGEILDANDNFLEIMGYRYADVCGRHHRMFVRPEEAQTEAYARFWRGLATGSFQSGVYRRVSRAGEDVWLQATYNAVLDLNGRPTKIIKYAVDITAQKLRDQDTQSQLNAIALSQGVMTFDMNGVILDANDAILSSLGYSAKELRGLHHSRLLEPGVAGKAESDQFWQTLRDGQFVAGRQKRVGKDGRQVWLQASYNPILNFDGEPYKVVKYATDVTADVLMAEAFEDAKQKSQHDSATALPNRSRLAAFLTDLLSQPQAQVTVLYVDVDHFKSINDTYGHAAGDRVLGEVADRLRRSLTHDQMVARIGGDEFAIAAPGLAEEDAETLCRNLIAIMSEPVRHDSNDLRLSLSIGIAMSPTDGLQPDDLLRSADVALYRAKANGRACYCFYAAEMNDRIQTARRLTEDMRRALASEEFFLEYQPRFDASTRKVRSAEALIRWAHPERGVISPATFIPLAERSGLIVPIGDWVLRTACNTAAGWEGTGVSVNVSPVQFRDKMLVERVRAALGESGLQPERLEIEVTEGVLLEDADRALRMLAELKSIGVRLAMDDFGTGYASLSYLRSFPFDVIKIDRQFTNDIDGRKGGRAVVQAILALAKALQLTVTAEGVETDGQLASLIEDECKEVQGYLLARPMKSGQLAALIDEHETSPGQASDAQPPPVRLNCEPPIQTHPVSARELAAIPGSLVMEQASPLPPTEPRPRRRRLERLVAAAHGD